MRVPARRDLKARLPGNRHRSTVRPNAVGQIEAEVRKRPRGQRILDGLAGVLAGGELHTWLGDFETVLIETVLLEMSVTNVALIT